jgi:hypothetical protein
MEDNKTPFTSPYLLAGILLVGGSLFYLSDQSIKRRGKDRNNSIAPLLRAARFTAWFSPAAFVVFNSSSLGNATPARFAVSLIGNAIVSFAWIMLFDP